MPTPSEHKSVQARILEYAKDIGWTYVSRDDAEQRRGFDPEVPAAERAKNRSMFFDDAIEAQVREFNPRYAEAEDALLVRFRHIHTDSYGNREFVKLLRSSGKYYDHEEKLERDDNRELFCSLLHELMTGKVRADYLELPLLKPTMI
jgi:type I restriction enzyme R subunit